MYASIRFPFSYYLTKVKNLTEMEKTVLYLFSDLLQET